MGHIEEYFDMVTKALSSIKKEEVERVIEILKKAREERNTIIIMGNGGSASNASHFVNGLSQGATVKNKPRFKALALTDNIPNMLAYANDYGYENIFSEQLKHLMEPRDVVIGISGSGNSKNIINAIEYAKEKNGITIGITGYDGGKLRGLVDHSIHVDSKVMEVVEDVHLSLTHLISWSLKQEK